MSLLWAILLKLEKRKTNFKIVRFSLYQGKKNEIIIKLTKQDNKLIFQVQFHK